MKTIIQQIKSGLWFSIKSICSSTIGAVVVIVVLKCIGVWDTFLI